MSKAQDLLANRKKNASDIEIRQFEKIEGAASLESYYDKILSDEDIERALEEYKGSYDKITEEFIEKTRLQKADLVFLFVAIALQCFRIYIINKLTAKENANAKNGKEDAIHDFQEKLLGKFGKGIDPLATPLYASLDAIITMRGVPYDATRYLDEEIKKLKLFKGANHRFSTLGHDPLLGLVFGTANILTNTITTNKKILITTNYVNYDVSLKNPKIGPAVPTLQMLNAASDRFKDDKKSVAAAVIKQLLHIATDLYTPCGITLPLAGLVLDNKSVETLTQYISTGDIVKVGASAGMAALINTLISAMHGCAYLLEKDESEFSKDLYQARTKKIIMYSNCIASTSNLITTAVSGDVSQLDVGGLLVTITRMFGDIKFLTKLEYEFINTNMSQIYDEKYSDIEMYYS